jgi:hypothetical protein
MTLTKHQGISLENAKSHPPAAGEQRRHLAGPERLTALGFRCWLAGYQSGTIDYWEQAWNAYAIALGPAAARTAVRDLSCWVRSVCAHARRDIQICPGLSDRFGHDECLAVSVIAAAQHDCPGVKACAFALLGAQPLDDVILSASRFAAGLRDNGLLLKPGPIVESLENAPATAAAATH